MSDREIEAAVPARVVAGKKSDMHEALRRHDGPAVPRALVAEEQRRLGVGTVPHLHEVTGAQPHTHNLQMQNVTAVGLFVSISQGPHGTTAQHKFKKF